MVTSMWCFLGNSIITIQHNLIDNIFQPQNPDKEQVL